MSGNRSGGRYDPYNWHYPRAFGQVYFATSIYEKDDGTRDDYTYGFIYTGTAHTTWNPANDGSNGLTNSYATFATWSEFPVYFFAIGTY